MSVSPNIIDLGDAGNGTWVNLPNKICYQGLSFWRWKEFGPPTGARGYYVWGQDSDPSLRVKTVVHPDGTITATTEGTPSYAVPGTNTTMGSGLEASMLQNAKGSLDSGTYYSRLVIKNPIDESQIFSPWIPYSNGTCNTGFPTSSSTLTTSKSAPTSPSMESQAPSSSRSFAATSRIASEAPSSSAIQGAGVGTKSRSMSGGAVAGIVIGTLVVIALLVLLLLCIRRRRRAASFATTDHITAFTPEPGPTAYRSEKLYPAHMWGEDYTASQSESLRGSTASVSTPFAPGIKGVQPRQQPTPFAKNSQPPSTASFDYNDHLVSLSESSPGQTSKSSSYPEAPARPDPPRATHEVDAGRLQRLKRPPPPGYSSSR